MVKKCFKCLILIIIVGFIFLSHVTSQVQAQDINQGQGVESSGDAQAKQEYTAERLATQEQEYKEREEKRERLLKRYLTDALELKNGNKIFGRVTGSASGATTIFNMETGEEEVISANAISSRRKTTDYEVKAVIDELKGWGGEDEVVPILDKRKEPKQEPFKKSYDAEARSADRARESLDKDLDRMHREDREDALAARARAEYLEDRRADQMIAENARRSQ